MNYIHTQLVVLYVRQWMLTDHTAEQKLRGNWNTFTIGKYISRPWLFTVSQTMQFIIMFLPFWYLLNPFVTINDTRKHLHIISFMVHAWHRPPVRFSLLICNTLIYSWIYYWILNSLTYIRSVKCNHECVRLNIIFLCNPWNAII